jgi:hypothetical protein
MSAQPQEHTKYCPRCRAVKSRDALAKDSHQHDGLRAYCTPCRAAYDRERWRMEHPDPPQPYFQGDERWDIDRLIARIEAQNAADLANGGSVFTTRPR